MKRLIFSDTHFHTWNYGASVLRNGFNSRLWSQFEAATEMIKDVEEYGIKYAYFCGDLFHLHGSVPTQALSVANGVFKALRSRGVKIRAIWGNHDVYDKAGGIHSLSFLSDEEISGCWNDGDLRVLALPYTDDEERLKVFLEGAGKVDGGMILLHQGVAGVPLSSGFMMDERLTPDMIPDNVRAFTGHYHIHRAVTPNLTVVGNLTPLNWGDINQEKGWVIWDDETGALEHRIQKSAPEFISFNSETGDVRNKFLRCTAPFETKQIPEVRADLIKEGAITVEFTNIKEHKTSKQIRSGEEITIDHLVEEFEKDIDDRRREVGDEIREEKYEPPCS